MLDFIIQNKEWLFSGAGISALTVVVLVIKHIASRRRRNLPPALPKIETAARPIEVLPQNSVSENYVADSPPYLPKPTPIEIEQEIEKVTPFQKKASEQSYTGLRIRWETRLLLAHPREKDSVSLGCRYEGYSRLVLIETSLDEYPFLKVASKGQRVVVYGKITGIDPNGPMIKADKLEFPEEEREQIVTST
jgi:hypothetical protein